GHRKRCGWSTRRIWEAGESPAQARCGESSLRGCEGPDKSEDRPRTRAWSMARIEREPQMPVQYPYSAVLGCEADALDDMGLALVLSTIAPEIGGVLIRGEKGTAKSTAVRGLAAVLPPIRAYTGDRFAIDPADPDATSPDGPFAHDAETEVRPARLVELPVGATEDRVLGSLHLQSAL